MANGWQFIRSDAAVKFLSICKNAYLVTWLVSELVSVTGKVKPGREVDIKYGEFYEEWEVISDIFADFVSSIDVVIRRVPGTQCE